MAQVPRFLRDLYDVPSFFVAEAKFLKVKFLPHETEHTNTTRTLRFASARQLLQARVIGTCDIVSVRHIKLNNARKVRFG